MELRNACRRRSIDRLGRTTPLLVPSFSSRGFVDVAEIHAATRNYLVDVSLVSAFDLHYGVLDESVIYATDLLLIDSGGYESRGLTDPLEPYTADMQGADWTLEAYKDLLRRLRPLSDVVMVNFDAAEPAPMTDQMDAARTLFGAHPGFATDFLCKPSLASARFVDIEEVSASVDDLSGFDLIGLTEKELGASLVDRCRALLLLRGALNRHGCQTPLHVFGCLDPATVLAYYLCGADVFDGLTWLRFAFRAGRTTSHLQAVLVGDNSAMRDEDAVLYNRVSNLMWLAEQQQAMRRIGCRDDLAGLGLDEMIVEKVESLVSDAGLDLGV